MAKLTENAIEELAIELLEQLGYQYCYGPALAPGEPSAERASFADVLLLDTKAVPDNSPVPAGLAGPLRDLVDLEGRTVVVTVGHPVLLDVAEQVISLPAAH